MRTVIGLFQDSNEARQTISDLQKLGARTQDISVVAPVGTSQIGAGMQLAQMDVPGLGRVAACGPVSTFLSQSTAQNAPGGIIAALVRMGISEPEARRYVDGVRQGSTLETVIIEDDKANEALQIMRDHSMTGGAPRGAGNVGGQQHLQGQGQTDRTPERGDQVLPVIVEELEVGKREVNAGGVRATTRVENIPAQEDVSLRQESVDVERRAVDRPIGAGDDAFRERSVEVIATSEEPVITKRARVIEEIVIRHHVGSKTETVRDTVRRTDVDVRPFDASNYREHYEREYGRARGAASGGQPAGNLGGTSGTASAIGGGGDIGEDSSDYDFSSYAPAYKFGHEMRGDERLAGDDWSSVEGNAKQTWETKNPGTWDRFKDAVKHAWERAKGD